MNETGKCEWCGSSKVVRGSRVENGCDCQDRMDCDKAGTIGHWGCGKRPCGCPKFIICEHEAEHGQREGSSGRSH